MSKVVELGLDTFGDVNEDETGQLISHAQAIRNVIDQGVLADEVGVDFFGVGEHHRADFAISSPETVLAAIAGQTEQIRLGSAVTVLSSDDPIRVFQRFATLDAASNGRAEVILGRGSFTESFPLFGFDLNDYDELFEEKLELFVKILEEGEVSWSIPEGATFVKRARRLFCGCAISLGLNADASQRRVGVIPEGATFVKRARRLFCGCAISLGLNADASQRRVGVKAGKPPEGSLDAGEARWRMLGGAELSDQGCVVRVTSCSRVGTRGVVSRSEACFGRASR